MKQPYKYYDKDLNLTLVELNIGDDKQISKDSLNDLMATLDLILDPKEGEESVLKYDKSKYLQ